MMKKKSESGCEVSGQRVVAADSYVDPTDHFGNESCHSFTSLCPGHQEIMLDDAGKELLLCPREVKMLKLTDSPVCPGWPRWPASQVECGVECPQLKLGNDQPSRVKSPLDQMTPPSF